VVKIRLYLNHVKLSVKINELDGTDTREESSVPGLLGVDAGNGSGSRSRIDGEQNVA
jgi:hypothetical protein